MSEFRCRRCGRDLDTGMRCWTIGCGTQDDLAALRAENERLREALEEILAADCMDEPPSHSEIPLDTCPSCIARAALAPEVKP